MSVIEVKSGKRGKGRFEYDMAKQGGSYKEKLRIAIDIATLKANSFKEFLQLLVAQGYEIKQGKYLSFKHKDGERFTRGKTIGEDYTEERIRERIKTKAPVKQQQSQQQPSIRKLLDLSQDKFQNSKGLNHWGKIQNLKIMADTMNLLREKGLTDLSEFDSKFEAANIAFDKVSDALKSTENRLNDLTELQKQLRIYGRTKEMYGQFQQAHNKDKFIRETDGAESDVMLHETAKRYLSAYKKQHGKVPKSTELKPLLATLQKEKSDLYEQYKGFHFRHSNGEYRCTEHTSLAVKSDRLSWYWHSKGIGGYGAIDFLMKIDGYDFKGALAVLTDEPTTAPPPPQTADIQKAFFLPEKAKSNRRAYAYLTLTRGLDNHIINELIQEKKIYEDTKGNAVFVGYDEQGKPKYATLRGTYTDKPFRMDCVGSDKRYCFCTNGTSSRLYIFESAIDSLSHATIENRLQGNTGAYRADNRLSLGGTSGIALSHYLQRYSHIKELVFCLDNDIAGKKRAVALAREYADKGYYTRLELPTLKDYNEVLLDYLKRNGGQL